MIGKILDYPQGYTNVFPFGAIHGILDKWDDHPFDQELFVPGVMPDRREMPFAQSPRDGEGGIEERGQDAIPFLYEAEKLFSRRNFQNMKIAMEGDDSFKAKNRWGSGKATKQYLPASISASNQAYDVKMYGSTIETWHHVAEKIGLQGKPTHESPGLPEADDYKVLADRLMATVAATGGSPTGQEPTEQPLLKTAKEPQPDEPDELQPSQCGRTRTSTEQKSW